MAWPLVVAIGAERALAALAIALLLAAAWCFRGNGDGGGGRASAAPPLPQLTGLGGAALFGWLFVVWAWWVDGHRDATLPGTLHPHSS